MKVVSIVFKPESSVADPETSYVRVPLDFANLVSGRGIEGDGKGGNPRRNLNIMSLETLEELKGEGFSTLPGQMGEQLVIQGVDMGKLVEGDRLQIGEQACVKVINQRTGCQRFEKIQGKSPRLAVGRLGVMAQVVIGGKIAVGDPVKLLQKTTQPDKPVPNSASTSELPGTA